MIGYLTGAVSHMADKYLILNVSGVGYLVYTSLDTLSKSSKNEELSLWIHTVVREDTLDLYGFLKEEELVFFKLIIGISGIGPKGALAILDVAPLGTLKSAISSGDMTYLTKVSGVGKKIAGKIVLELKDKMDTVGNEDETSMLRGEDMDVLDALKSLGYREKEAREALKDLPKGVTGTSKKIKEALKLLGGE